MRFFGEIGFGFPVRKNGVTEDVITARQYTGDVVQNTQIESTSGSVLPESSFQTTIRVVADAYALENFTAIRYVQWAGSLWTVRSVATQRPRLLLMIGEVYNGPKAATPDTP